MTTYEKIYFRDKASSSILASIDATDTLIQIPQEDFSTFYNLPTAEQYDDLYMYAVLRSAYNQEVIVIDRANSIPATNQLKIIRNVDGYGAFAWGKGALIFRDLTKTLLETFTPKHKRTYSGDPDGIVTSLYTGEILKDTLNDAMHISTGGGSTAWKIFAGEISWFQRFYHDTSTGWTEQNALDDMWDEVLSQWKPETTDVPKDSHIAITPFPVGGWQEDHLLKIKITFIGIATLELHIQEEGIGDSVPAQFITSGQEIDMVEWVIPELLNLNAYDPDLSWRVTNIEFLVGPEV